MPFCPGTGIPYGMSPLAFSAGTAKARGTLAVAVTFGSWTTFTTCSSGVGEAFVTFEIREPERRGGGFAFFSVGFGDVRGWKAFETDCPTFLIKSPTGSALA
jgi:hypothetical protein